MKTPCGCCEGIQAVTPMSLWNRPGLDTLACRVGTHAAFFETMKARLSSSEYPQLAGLNTREANDPSIALLDAWATLADVLTFYQERIANEGFLRTATERLSILELAKLVGYRLRPGVAASVYLAYTLDKGYSVEIPAGSRAQSIPGPNEQMQSFETSEAFKARDEWNLLQPRLTRPQLITTDRTNLNVDTVYFEGTTTKLNANDALLFVFTGKGSQILKFVKTVETDYENKRTKVTLINPVLKVMKTEKLEKIGSPAGSNYLVRPFTKVLSTQAINSVNLMSNVEDVFNAQSGIKLQLLDNFFPAQEGLFAAIFGSMFNRNPGQLQAVYALRTRAQLFGYNASKMPTYDGTKLKSQDQWTDWSPKDDAKDEQSSLIFLDNAYPQITNGIDSFIVIKQGDSDAQIFTIDNSVIRARSAYGINGTTTAVTLSDPAGWWTPGTDMSPIRGTVVYAGSEKLPLAEEPIDPIKDYIGPDPHDPEKGKSIELAGLYEGLQSGRWIIVAGEQTDILNSEGGSVTGVPAQELVMLSGVKQNYNSLPGDKMHSTLILANALSHSYKRDTVKIYGNVVKATHGETVAEILGSGDASRTFQQFALKRAPLTHVSAPIVNGAESTLRVRVNDVLWHETDDFIDATPTDHDYITKKDNAEKTSVIAGNGEEGARVPTGTANVKAVYRSGIGKAGNVKIEQISQLATKPLGVKAVINPMRASGGADPDSRDQARRNAPLPTRSLDRLVSVRDYADFSRTFAGIGKASATQLSDGQRRVVHVTIAGADDIPIDETSDLFQNLCRALHDAGDPYQPIQVAVRKLLFLVISANVRVLPDYQWESVEPVIRANLLDAFSFERRELGQSVFLSEVQSVIQRVPGVEYVDVNFFGGISEDYDPEKLDLKNGQINDPIVVSFAQVTADSKITAPEKRLLPAELAYLTPNVPDTLILKEVKP